MRYTQSIPRGWKLRHIGDLTADLKAGTSVNGFDEPSTNGKPGVLKLSAVSNGRFFPNENKTVRPDEIGRLGPSVTKGTLLISRSNTAELVGACTCIRQDFPHLYVPDLLWVIETEANCDPVWLQYLCAGMPVRRGIYAIATGTSGSMKKISMSAFRKIPVPCSPLPEQQKIAAILSTWDRAIELTEKLIAAKQKRKQALMQQLLTGKVQFKEFEGQQTTSTELKSLTSIFDGTHTTPKYTTTGIPFYSVEHLTKNDFSKTKYIARDVFEKENERVRLERDDILMTRIGDIGTARQIDWDVEASFYVSLALIKKSKDFDSAYLSQYLNSADFQRELHRRTIHAAFPKKINLGEIGKCKVVVPPKLEQERIGVVLRAADTEVNALKRKVSKLQKQKKGLMQQLLTGNVRVKVDAETEQV